MAEFPILEYDPDRDALISPSVTTLRPSGGESIPRVAVACLFQELIESECVRAGARVVATLTAEHGTHPVYAVERGGQSVAVFHRASVRLWQWGSSKRSSHWEFAPWWRVGALAP